MLLPLADVENWEKYMAIIVEFEGKRPRVPGTAFLAPTAVLIGDVDVGEYASIWFGAILRGDFAPIKIGAGSNVQDNVIVHEGTTLEENVTVGHGAILHDCWIGKNTLIGMGSIVLDQSRIGSQCLIAAGSVLKEFTQIQDGLLVAGNPATPKKRITGRSAEWVQRAANDYVKLTGRYRTGYRVIETPCSELRI